MTEFIIVLSVVFITAGAMLLIANQFGFPPVPFYLIAGLLTGAVVDQSAIVDLALWGIAFLVFVFGIRIDFSDLRSVLRDGEGAAFIQLIVVAPIAFAIGYLLCVAFGIADPFRNAIYFAAAATLSSTLIGVSILQEELRSSLVYGRLASSIHLFDDIVAIGALAVLSAETLTNPQLLTSKIGYAVLFMLVGLLIYRHGFPLLIRAADGSDELVLMGCISILIAFIAAAETVGISIVVGAFAAGVAVRNEGADSLGVRNGIESIKDFFVAIFFVTVGALVALPTVEVLLFAVILCILVVVFNPIVHMFAFVYEGYDGRTAFLAGSSLNQVSELALVIAIQAWLLGTIATALFDAVILAAVITMILSVLTARYENTLYNTVFVHLVGERTEYIDSQSRVDDDISDHVVVIGYGRQGRRLVAQLEELEQPYVVIENDPAIKDYLRAECRNYIFGDAMADYPIERARLGDARLVVSTAEHAPVSESLLDRETDADLVLRAGSSRDARGLLDAGATYVSVPSVLASDQLVENVARVLDDEKIAATLEDEHREYLERIEWTGSERRSIGPNAGR